MKIIRRYSIPRNQIESHSKSELLEEYIHKKLYDEITTELQKNTSAIRKTEDGIDITYTLEMNVYTSEQITKIREQLSALYENDNITLQDRNYLIKLLGG